MSYTYSIVQNCNYFNSSNIVFDFTIPSGANTSFSSNYTIKISNLTLTNPSAPVDAFSLNSQNFTTYSLTKYKSTYNITAYKNYTNAQSSQIKFSTSETVNYYPTINYAVVKWSGGGITAKLIVNATNKGNGFSFTTETLEIVNINWGDGSALQTSSMQEGSYNWTFYHNYTATGSYSVSFQVVNWVGNSNSLSVSKTLTYSLSISISTSPANNAVLSHDEKIYFNWTASNLGVRYVSLTIDSILQYQEIYHNITSGSLNDTPNYLGTLSVSWHWKAGNMSGYDNLTYTTASSVAKTGLYVLANYTLDSTQYSNYYYYSQVSPYNLTWSYFIWNIQIPNGSTLESIKGNTLWQFISAFPGLYVYYSGNATLHYYEKATMYQVVFLAPLPPSFGYFTIQLEDSAGNTIGSSGASFENYQVYVNNQPVAYNVIPAETGETYNIKVYSEPFHSLLSNSNYTVNYPVSEDVIELPVYPLAIDNLNQSYFLLLSVEQNGITQNISFIGIGQTNDFSIAAGTYYLNFTLWGQSGDTGLEVSKLTTITGPSIQWMTGSTLVQVQSQIKNQTNLIENVNLTLVSQGNNIKNQTVNIQVSMKNLNSTIGNQFTSFNVTMQNILSIVEHSNVTLSQKIVYTDALINASDYRYVPGSPTISGNTYSYPIQVIYQKTGLPANLSQTEQAAHNLQAELVLPLGSISIPFYITNIQSGSFVLNMNLTKEQIGEIQNGSYIAMMGAIGMTNATVAGKISSANLSPNLNTMQDIFAYLAYLDQTSIGRAEYLIAGFLAMIYYTIVLTRKNEKKGKKK